MDCCRRMVLQLGGPGVLLGASHKVAKPDLCDGCMFFAIVDKGDEDNDPGAG